MGGRMCVPGTLRLGRWQGFSPVPEDGTHRQGAQTAAVPCKMFRASSSSPPPLFLLTLRDIRGERERHLLTPNKQELQFRDRL